MEPDLAIARHRDEVKDNAAEAVACEKQHGSIPEVGLGAVHGPGLVQQPEGAVTTEQPIPNLMEDEQLLFGGEVEHVCTMAARRLRRVSLAARRVTRVMDRNIRRQPLSASMS